MEKRELTPEEFRKEGYRVVDFIAEYFSNIEQYPVLSKVKPGEVEKSLPEEPPEEGEDFGQILEDIRKIIVPGLTHWNHPHFHAYFNSTSSSAGIFAEFLTASFNSNGMLWKTSPALTELEEVMSKWFKELLDLPKDFSGIIYDTASVSSMHAIAAARESTKLEIRTKGMSGRKDLPRLILYESEQTHSSIDKGAITLGIGMGNVRKIPVDDKFGMIPSLLREEIRKDKEKGNLPFCVVATIGTTSTTSIDPLSEIARITKEENLWLHVDAAYAGPAAILPEKRYIFEGLEFADSLVINPHKWFFVPIDLSILYVKNRNLLKQAFSLEAEYLKTNEDAVVTNFMDYGIQLGRRFRALKLWFVIRYFGKKGLIAIFRKHIELAKKFARWVDNHDEMEIMAPVNFGTVAFRFIPRFLKDVKSINEFNETLLNNVNSEGKIFISHTRLNGLFTLRFVVGGIRMEERHVDEAISILQEHLETLKNKFV